MSWVEAAQRIEKDIHSLPAQDISYGLLEEESKRENRILNLILNSGSSLDTNVQTRIKEEFLGAGPVETLINDESITEILILSKNEIWFEKNGSLFRKDDTFLSEHTYHSFIERICQEAKTHFTLERPIANGSFRGFRLHLISSELTRSSHNISLRRHPKNPWTFRRLLDSDWCPESTFSTIQKIINEKASFLVIGGTGTGKTSFLNATLQALPQTERVILIEDTPELSIPNQVSTKLITRIDANNVLPPVDQGELVRQALRMRPDRLVMGEIRGPEAKDLLMALSTGHEGSFGSMHASSAAQALLRLEMLVQLGAPQWNLNAIRSLIFLSIKYIFIVDKNSDGNRHLESIYRLSSIEDHGILLDRIV